MLSEKHNPHVRLERLLAATPELRQALAEWKKSEGFKNKVELTQSAWQDMDMSAPILSDMDFPKYALSALVDTQMNFEAFISLSIFWAAKKDYGDCMSNFRSFEINNGPEVRSILKSFLTIDEMTEDAARKITDSELNKIIQLTQQSSQAASEQQFHVFDIPKDQIAPILTRILDLKFKLLMPQDLGDRYRLIIPSYTLMNSILSVFGEAKFDFVPMFGECSATDVLDMHAAKEHPLGLSFPGIEQNMADSFHAGCYGFILHDNYHRTLLETVNIFSAVHRFARLLLDLAEQADDHEAQAINELANHMIDGEFREQLLLQTIGNQLTGKLRNDFNSSISQSGIWILLSRVDIILFNAFIKGIATSYGIGDTNDPASLARIPNLAAIVQHYHHPRAKALFPQEIREMMTAQAQELELDIELPFDYPALAQRLKACLLNDIATNPEVYAESSVSLSSILHYLLNTGNSRQLSAASNAMMLLQHLQQGNHEQVGTTLISYSGTMRFEEWANRLLYGEQQTAEPICAVLTEAVKLQEACFKYVNASDAESLQQLLADNPEFNPNICDSSHMGLLHLAASKNDVEVLRVLLAHPAIDINLVFGEVTLTPDMLMKLNGHSKSSFSGTTALHEAAKAGATDAMALLVEHDADCLIKDKNDKLALHYSIEHDDVEATRFLLNQINLSQAETQSLISQSPTRVQTLLEAYQSFKADYHQALTSGHEAFAQFLSNHDQRFSLCSTLLDGKNPLTIAQDIESFERLIQVGVPISETRHMKVNCLHEILAQDELSELDQLKLQRLLELGADVLVFDDEQNTCLDLAIKNGHDILDLLLAHVDSFDRFHMSIYSPLLVFIQNLVANNGQWRENDIEQFIKLVEHGADVQKVLPYVEQSFVPVPPRMLSIWQILRDFPIRAQNAGPSFFAQSQRIALPTRCSMACIDHGADPNAPSVGGQLELHRAIKDGDREYAEFLLQRGVRPLEQNGDNLNAYQVAHEYNRHEMVTELSDYMNPQFMLEYSPFSEQERSEDQLEADDNFAEQPMPLLDALEEQDEEREQAKLDEEQQVDLSQRVHRTCNLNMQNLFTPAIVVLVFSLLIYQAMSEPTSSYQFYPH